MTAERLASALERHAKLAVAVSGGVDSMTLAAFAHRSRSGVSVFHARSPAVPPAATARVERLAAAEGWHLTIADAGEFADPRYLANPVNRCYFCKSNLYDRILALTDASVASGTNTDDLGDYRPGLAAAAERTVAHPFVEAGMDKQSVRALARDLGLGDLSELPAQPCLSSRVETGIAISAANLAFIDQVETALTAALPGRTAVRCRVTRNGVIVELEPFSGDTAVRDMSEALCRTHGRVLAEVRPYRRGAMFLRDGA